jgi:hypothetical protein
MSAQTAAYMADLIGQPCSVTNYSEHCQGWGGHGLMYHVEAERTRTGSNIRRGKGVERQFRLDNNAIRAICRQCPSDSAYVAVMRGLSSQIIQSQHRENNKYCGDSKRGKGWQVLESLDDHPDEFHI